MIVLILPLSKGRGVRGEMDTKERRRDEFLLKMVSYQAGSKSLNHIYSKFQKIGLGL
jgi:hypothetical protein